jgi:hypothetical protein
MDSGILILDNNCYSHLAKPGAMSKFRSNLRVSDFLAQPTEVNLLEAAAAPASVRARLFDVLREVKGRQPILMWPFRLLKEIGQAIVLGNPSVTVGESGREWYLEDHGAVEELQAEVRAFQKRLETEFGRLHAQNRKNIQAKMRSAGIESGFESTAHFLDSYWHQSESRRDFANFTWDSFGLPGEAPIDALNRNESWRLLLDVEGVALYERAITRTQPKLVHRFDLIQLTYLGLAQRRMIATADRPLLRAANAILLGRYPNARAVHIQDLVI